MMSLSTGLGGRKTRQRERYMMKDFDVIPSNECLIGLWPGKPAHMQKILISATGPVLSSTNRRTSGVGSAAVAVLKRKRRKFFELHKSREPLRTSSVPARSSQSVQRQLQRAHSQQETIDIQDIVSPSTTNDSFTTNSSDTFEVSVASRDELFSPIVSEDSN